jgi:hypothetical protein
LLKAVLRSGEEEVGSFECSFREGHVGIVAVVLQRRLPGDLAVLSSREDVLSSSSTHPCSSFSPICSLSASVVSRLE